MTDTKAMFEQILAGQQAGFTSLNARMDQTDIRLDTVSSEVASLATRLTKCEMEVSKSSSADRAESRGKSRRTEHGAANVSSQDLDEKAKNLCVLRLRGFPGRPPKPDLIAATISVLDVLKVDRAAHVSNIFAGGLARSSVVEFISEEVATSVFNASRTHGSIPFTIEGYDLPINLKLTHNESKELGAMGAALRILWKETQTTIASAKPSDYKPALGLHAERYSGKLSLKIDKIFLPLFKISANQDGLFRFDPSFYSGGHRGIPGFITEALRGVIMDKTCADELFSADNLGR